MAPLARGVRALKTRATRSPLDYIAWLPYQIEWLSHTDPRPHLLRLGNRMGKTTTGLAELIFRCRGRHPFKTVPSGRPVHCALVCMSMSQSVAIQRVLWELLGAEHNTELVAETEWTHRRGFRGHRPVVEWATTGSTITIYSNAQGAGALAGSEYDYILCDEPVSQETFDECRARVRNTGGNVGITLTPINGPPLPWLQALCEPEEGEPQVIDYHTRLTPGSQISPLTGQVRKTKDGRPWDEEFIDEIRRLENPLDSPIRLDGEWQSRVEGLFFDCFDANKHVGRYTGSEVLSLCLGVDYAAADREYGMCAVLTGVFQVQTEDHGTELRIRVLDEIVVPGTTSMDGFAAEILKHLGNLLSTITETRA